LTFHEAKLYGLKEMKNICIPFDAQLYVLQSLLITFVFIFNFLAFKGWIKIDGEKSFGSK
jgi:hypothetical protein